MVYFPSIFLSSLIVQKIYYLLSLATFLQEVWNDSRLDSDALQWLSSMLNGEREKEVS